MEVSNPNYEIKLELEAFNEKINEFWDFYYYLSTADSITKRYHRDMEQEISNGNFVNAKICINKLIQRLNTEKDRECYVNVRYQFISAIEELKIADKICDKILESVINENLDEKKTLKEQKKEINIKLTEEFDKKLPYLNLSLSIIFILVSIIFAFLPNYFYNPIFLYHLCGGMLIVGLCLLCREIPYRCKKGFKRDIPDVTNKVSIFFLVFAILSLIPIIIPFILSSDSILLRIMSFINILLCSEMFLWGLLINLLNKNKKITWKNIWTIISAFIAIASFVLQLLQIFNVI